MYVSDVYFASSVLSIQDEFKCLSCMFNVKTLMSVTDLLVGGTKKNRADLS